MKKKVIAMALAVMAAAGISISAQTTADSNQNATQKCGAPCKQECGAPGNNDKMARPHKFTDFAFEGILLDVNQQQRMDSLNAAVDAQRKAQRPGQEGRPGRHGKMRGISPEYVKQVKDILTPEQYTMFLENIVLMPQRVDANKQDCANQNCPSRKQSKDGFNKERGRKGMNGDKSANMKNRGDKARGRSAEN